MKVPLRWKLIVPIALIAAALICSPGRSQDVGRRYFGETGHWVSGDFLLYYESISNPEMLLGYPITDEFTYLDPNQPDQPEYQVQYFQRARLERHADREADLRVVPSPLGTYVHEYDQPGEVVTIPENNPACELIPDAELRVCYSFLQFFKANGGVTQFGYPISEAELRDGQMVQYFQRARLEWHPDLPLGQRVVLTDLGTWYFYYNKEDNSRLLGDYIPHPLLELQVQAYVENPVMAPDGSQALYVVVLDQSHSPVPNAQVTVQLLYPDGKQEGYIMPLTNKDGISSSPIITLKNQPYGITEIAVKVKSGDFDATTRTSFRVWY